MVTNFDELSKKRNNNGKVSPELENKRKRPIKQPGALGGYQKQLIQYSKIGGNMTIREKYGIQNNKMLKGKPMN